jgi:hypothetical protein
MSPMGDPEPVLIREEGGVERRKYEIECGRCGEAGLEFLTEEEVRVIGDGTGPAYRQCERCGKMTGWIAASGHGTPRGAAKQGPIQTTGRPPESPTPHGQERMATQSERDQMKAMLRRPEAVSVEKSRPTDPTSRVPPRGGHNS